MRRGYQVLAKPYVKQFTPHFASHIALTRRSRQVMLAARHKLPAIYNRRHFVTSGPAEAHIAKVLPKHYLLRVPSL